MARASQRATLRKVKQGSLVINKKGKAVIAKQELIQEPEIKEGSESTISNVEVKIPVLETTQSEAEVKEEKEVKAKVLEEKVVVEAEKRKTTKAKSDVFEKKSTSTSTTSKRKRRSKKSSSKS